MNDKPAQQAQGIYHTRIGEFIVTTLSDGYLRPPFDIVQGIGKDEAARIMNDAFLPGDPVINVNAFVVRGGGKTYLIDTGAGGLMGETAGRLQGALAAAGIAAGDIDAILMTHLHGDHVGGLIDAQGHALFPKAALIAHEREVDFWFGAGADTNTAGREQNIAAVRMTVGPYKERLTTFSGSDVVPGIAAEFLPGHTPGHCGFRIQSGKDDLLIWGDIVHLPVIQADHPEVTLVFDTDPALAASTRKKMFDMAAADKLLVAGMHMTFPGFVHVKRGASGYSFLQAPWGPLL